MLFEDLTVAESLIVSYQRGVLKSRLVSLKKHDVFQCLVWKLVNWKRLALKEPLVDVMLHSGNCSDWQMALQTISSSIGQFEGLSKAQLNSW